MHKKFHKSLQKKLKAKYNKSFWRWKTDIEWRTFLDDPIRREEVSKILLETSMEMDSELGGDVLTTALIEQIDLQKWFLK